VFAIVLKKEEFEINESPLAGNSSGFNFSIPPITSPLSSVPIDVQYYIVAFIMAMLSIILYINDKKRRKKEETQQ
jgi:hypothetical protein